MLNEMFQKNNTKVLEYISLSHQKEYFMKQKALISEECWFVRNFLEPRRKVEIYYVAANLFFRVTKSEMVDDIIPKIPKKKFAILYCTNIFS